MNKMNGMNKTNGMNKMNGMNKTNGMTTKHLYVMVFYSMLTFFIVPYTLIPYLKGIQDPYFISMLIGFTLSIILWENIGKSYVKYGM